MTENLNEHLKRLFPQALVVERINKVSTGVSYQVRSPLGSFVLEVLVTGENQFVTELTFTLHTGKLSMVYRNHGLDQFDRIRDLLITVQEDLNRTFVPALPVTPPV